MRSRRSRIRPRKNPPNSESNREEDPYRSHPHQNGPSSRPKTPTQPNSTTQKHEPPTTRTTAFTQKNEKPETATSDQNHNAQSTNTTAAVTTHDQSRKNINKEKKIEGIGLPLAAFATLAGLPLAALPLVALASAPVPFVGVAVPLLLAEAAAVQPLALLAGMDHPQGV